MQIVFLCPPVRVINGGIKYIFRMAEALRAQGCDAVVFEQQERRPAWLVTTAPVVGQSVLRPDADQVYVLPEDQPNLLAQFKNWPQRKVIYSQNHFYAARGIADARSYADFGISHIICSSHTILEQVRTRHPSLTAHLVPYGIDNALFKPGANKHDRIAFMPRKRPIEAAYIRDMFRYAHPRYRDWEWRELSNLSEGEVARELGDARVFLSLSRLEGFGLTPIEAMSAGCVVAGFTGIGGREYAHAGNGFWAEEDDFPACIAQLEKAAALARDGGAARAAYAEACRETVAAYTPAKFREAVRDAWARIL